MASAVLAPRSDRRPSTYPAALRRRASDRRDSTNGRRKPSRRGAKPRSRPGWTSASSSISSSRARKRRSIGLLPSVGGIRRGALYPTPYDRQERDTVELQKYASSVFPDAW